MQKSEKYNLVPEILSSFIPINRKNSLSTPPTFHTSLSPEIVRLNAFVKFTKWEKLETITQIDENP